MRSDRDWMYTRNPESMEDFLKGVQEFISFATTQLGYMDGEKIKCTCLKCRIQKYIKSDLCLSHLIKHGFMANYHTWSANGESSQTSNVYTFRRKRPSLGYNERTTNRYESMIHDMDSSFQPNVENEASTSSNFNTYILSERFWKALNAAHQPIWPGNDSESKLSATVKHLNMKSENNWSERAVNQNLDYIRSMLPKDNCMPDSYYSMKKLVEDLGLPVIRIDVCRDGCMLFWGEDIDKQSCSFCHQSRYKENVRKLKPHKQLFYLPLAPRLQRLYTSNVTAPHMTWHGRHVNKPEIMCHPSDGEAWKRFDHHHPIFALEHRNVRLGLCSDGFAPFGQYGKAYSCWPVILTPYNLPPGMCMKSPYMFISLIIPGPKSPQRKIDIFLQPLIDELKMLWNVGVPTYDVSRGDTFIMKAMLLWTVSDFPAYGMLSGWSTHGIDSCPICMKKSKSFRLKYGRKACYFDCHRQFLPLEHPYRHDTQHFTKNRVERTIHPHIKDGDEIWTEISHLKLVSEAPNEYPHGFGDYHKWTKRSIFWELPYWGKLLIRHNLDFMHIEKNVFENIINTVMNVKGKTKDNLNARKDMFLVCNRPELHVDPNTTSRKPNKASYSLTKTENMIICKWVKTLKFPDGYASNLSRCVDTTESRLIGFKSHDCHVFLERLLPIAFRRLLPKFVWGTLADLSNFMNDLSGRTLSSDQVDNLHSQIPVILCNLEKIFPPSFFDSMEHLLIHLPYEAKIGGPVQYRWMYPFERFLKSVKQKVKNKARIEASICNAYILEEISTFASYYFESKVSCKQRQPQRNTEGPVNITEPPISIFNYLGRGTGGSSKRFMSSQETLSAHNYVLLNCPEVDPYYRAFCDMNVGLDPDEIVCQFSSWFRSKVVQDNRRNTEKDLPYFISFGPKTPATTYSTYFINGYVWRAGDYGSNRSTMNSGISVHANDVDYYGLLEEIIELQYPGPCLRVVLFRCIWFDPTRGTRVNPTYRLIDVNMKHRLRKYDPFVLAQQAIQVYYSNYPTPMNDPNCEWLAVCKTKARGKIEEIWKNEVEVEYQQEYPTIELYIPLDIPLYNVNDLSDPNILNVELDGSDEIESHESGSEETENVSDSYYSTNEDVEPILGEEQSGDDMF
ncbi:uncharacterized protein LOC124937589 isoform X1 [Impatiens glandulifera]|uniref:uncharacterized protein LOC124937589 isoform X1 n=1 Tax=Impatiens glandulifera TaxID=253017 RepID=UPI001FB0C7F6|nr:uncharacterized protein LOC124937589 isoform X1 [Impatiens glandulifera]